MSDWVPELDRELDFIDGPDKPHRDDVMRMSLAKHIEAGMRPGEVRFITGGAAESKLVQYLEKIPLRATVSETP